MWHSLPDRQVGGVAICHARWWARLLVKAQSRVQDYPAPEETCEPSPSRVSWWHRMRLDR